MRYHGTVQSLWIRSGKKDDSSKRAFRFSQRLNYLIAYYRSGPAACKWRGVGFGEVLFAELTFLCMDNYNRYNSVYVDLAVCILFLFVDMIRVGMWFQSLGLEEDIVL